MKKRLIPTAIDAAQEVKALRQEVARFSGDADREKG